MDFANLLFYFFAGVLLFSAVRVVSAPDSVQSALFLVLAFFNAAALWLLLQAEFLAILLVLVYVGAVMVLFLFVVMMLDFKASTLREDFKRFMPLAAGVGILMMLETGLILWHSYSATATALAAQHMGEQVSTYSNTHMLGKLIYTDYIFAFEIAGLVLLVAIIAALALTLRHGKDRKRTDIAEQLRASPAGRVRLVKMQSEQSIPQETSEPKLNA